MSVLKTMSVVIPVKNRENLIVRCLDSIYNQNYRPLDIVVVDNGSTDNTRAVVETWSNAHATSDFSLRIFDESRPGAPKARNRGLAEVSSEYMMFFDSDDTMHADLIAKVMGQFASDKSLDLVCWWSCIIGRGKKPHLRRYNVKNIWARHLYNCVLSTQCFAAKTSLYKTIGGWNENLTGWEDWELGVRLLLQNPKIRLIPEILVDIYHQKESITGSEFHSRAGKWERSLNNAESAILISDNPEKERLALMINYVRSVLAAHYKSEGKDKLACNLLSEALAKDNMVWWRRTLMKALWRYTSSGGRGAYMFWR